MMNKSIHNISKSTIYGSALHKTQSYVVISRQFKHPNFI